MEIIFAIVIAILFLIFVKGSDYINVRGHKRGESSVRPHKRRKPRR